MQADAASVPMDGLNFNLLNPLGMFAFICF